jgi:hypothetical protein
LIVLAVTWAAKLEGFSTLVNNGLPILVGSIVGRRGAKQGGFSDVATAH